MDKLKKSVSEILVKCAGDRAALMKERTVAEDALAAANRRLRELSEQEAAAIDKAVADSGVSREQLAAPAEPDDTPRVEAAIVASFERNTK